MTSRSLTSRTALALGALASLALATPAFADGMEPVATPKTHHHRHHHARVAHRHHAHQPLIGSVIKHVHDDPSGPVYAMPVWPACRYVLNTTDVVSGSSPYTGQFDCGS